MKIDNDLRCVIRAAEKTQKGRDSYEARNKRNSNAIVSFLKANPKKAKALRHAAKEILRLGKVIKKHEALISECGLSREWDGVSLRLRCEKTFQKAGGVITQSPDVWTANRVIAELAAADPKEGDRILRRYGINWK
jgi:hypothetical protein